MAFRRFAPQNLPSLTFHERTAFAGLAGYLPQLEANIHETLRTRFQVFADLAERDAFFTSPEIGEACLVRPHTDPSTGFDVGATLWTYVEYLTTGFNLLETWMPYDLQFSAYIPTLTNLTDGTSTAYYRRVGVDCRVEWQWSFVGGAPAVGGNPTFSLPFQGITKTTSMIGGAHTLGEAFLIDDNSSDAFGVAIVTASPFTSMILQYQRADLTFVSNASISGAAPFTWATNDRMIAHVNYEIDIENVTFTS